LGQGNTKFVLGATVGAVGGFAIGAFATTPTARSARESAFGGLDVSARFLGRTVLRAVDGMGSIVESGYTRIRGREKYLEHQIDDLREEISRLQQRID
jgi:flagellar capping protein FliD